MSLVLLAIAVFGTARFCHHETAGFKVSKIRDNIIPGNPFPAPSYSAAYQEEIETILREPFTFLGRGLQTFAFLSADGNYVLKIFNNSPQWKSSWFKKIPMEWAQKKGALLSAKYSAWQQSAQLCYEEMQKETGLLYLHLAPTSNQLPSVQLIDCLNISNSIEVIHTAFVIQKRAKLVYPTLLSMRKKSDHETATQAITALLNMIEVRFAKGISDSDPLIRTNFGFVEAEPIQIDIGPFAKSPAVQDPLFFKREMIRICQSMKEWVAANYPEISPFVEEEIRRRYD